MTEWDKMIFHQWVFNYILKDDKVGSNFRAIQFLILTWKHNNTRNTISFLVSKISFIF